MDSVKKQVLELRNLEKETRARLNLIGEGALNNFFEGVFLWVQGTRGDRNILESDQSERAIRLCARILSRMNIDLNALLQGYDDPSCRRDAVRKDLQKRVSDSISKIGKKELMGNERGLLAIISGHSKKADGTSIESLAVLHFADKFLEALVEVVQ